MSLKIIILAAGQGKRMNSDLPKVLHTLAGKPLLSHVLSQAESLSPDMILVVHGHQGHRIQEAISHPRLVWVHQEQQLGTGHAVACCLPHLQPTDRVLILAGDVPLIQADTLQALLQESTSSELGLLTAVLTQPYGLGRVKRGPNQHITSIVEERDATPAEKQITEINTGIIVASGQFLHEFLPKLSNQNAQQEYYLTEIFQLAVEKGMQISSELAPPDQIRGINTLAELSIAERIFQRMQAEAVMAAGIKLLDPARFDLRGTLTAGRDVSIDINVICEGQVSLGSNVVIESNVILKNVIMGDGVRIKSNSVLEDCEIGTDCQIGPFARIRPGTVLAQGVHIGNFVELKKALVSDHSKISHLSYVGDAEIGKYVNIGAGTITCNYDGVNKHQTIIEDHAFVGSNTQLVAPVTVGAGATIGAGSTITRDVAPATLALSRVAQQSITGWKRPTKKES